jgi:hypothetical protein
MPENTPTRRELMVSATNALNLAQMIRTTMRTIPRAATIRTRVSWACHGSCILSAVKSARIPTPAAQAFMMILRSGSAVQVQFPDDIRDDFFRSWANNDPDERFIACRFLQGFELACQQTGWHEVTVAQGEPVRDRLFVTRPGK